MRILITGGGGMLAQDLAEVLASEHEVIALGHAACDITDPAAARDVLAECRPELVINCAAYSDVDGCERDPERAWAVNGRGAGNVARAADAVGARVFHIGTDYVFDGRQQTPYAEDAPPNPLSAYGESKLEGERRTRENGGASKHLVIRTSWLFGFHRTNFVDKVWEGAQSRPQIEAVENQTSCLTWTWHLAQKISELAATRATGILHVVGGGACSRFDVAKRIMEKLPRHVPVVPITWAKLNLPAVRPLYSVMGTQRLAEFGLRRLPRWEEALDEYLLLRPAIAAGKAT